MENYLGFLVFATLLAAAPGPDMLLTIQATVLGGRSRGFATIAGISSAAILQGLLVVWGLAAVLARSQPLFLAIRVVGVLYLLYMGATAIRAAVKGGLSPATEAASDRPEPKRRKRLFWSNARQGFLCNITNPKVLMFNLAVLPQFVSSDAPAAKLLAYCFTLVAIGTAALVVVALTANAARRALAKPRARRCVNAATGTVMVGFAAALAAEA